MWDAIRARRNVRSYSEQAIAPEDLAADLGIGSAHAAVAEQELARRLLGFPEDRFCAWLITLGGPADRPLAPIERPDRRPFGDVVHRGHW